MRSDQRILEIRTGRRWPLVDEPVGLVVAGARPGSEVAVRATVEVAGAVHQARATFDADQAGVVDTARQASRAGSYTGVDPFGLWWSGQPVGPSRRPPSAPLAARVQAATAGRMAEAVLERHWLTLGATATRCASRGCGGCSPGRPGTARSQAWSALAAPAAAWPRRPRGRRCWPPTGSRPWPSPTSASPACPGRWSASRSRWSSGRPPGCSAAPTSGAGGSPSWGCPGAASSPCWPARCWTGWGRWSPSRPAESPGGGYGPGGPVDAPAWSFRGAPIPYLGGDATPPPGFRTAGPITLRPLFERALQDADAVRAAETPSSGPPARSCWSPARPTPCASHPPGRVGRASGGGRPLRPPGRPPALPGRRPRRRRCPRHPGTHRGPPPGRRRLVCAWGDARGQRGGPGRLLATGALAFLAAGLRGAGQDGLTRGSSRA
jgi:hypothetical protein